VPEPLAPGHLEGVLPCDGVEAGIAGQQAAPEALAAPVHLLDQTRLEPGQPGIPPHGTARSDLRHEGRAEREQRRDGDGGDLEHCGEAESSTGPIGSGGVRIPWPGGAMSRYTSFGEFYPFYLGEHSDPRTRACHYLGTSAGIAVLAGALLLGEPLLAVAAPVVGYAGPWFGHFAFEINRPATFRHPLWSLAGDYRMLLVAATGRLDHSHFRSRRAPVPGSR
jgi:hypothetical protein